MGFSLEFALRYIGSKKRAFVSVGTVFAIIGVALGVAALATVMSVTGGFRAEFREKVLGVNAHVLVLKYSSDFREYREIMDQMKSVPGVEGIAPFVISPMMVTHGDKTATGVLLKGVDPELMPSVLDLPRHVVEVLTPEGVVRHNSGARPAAAGSSSGRAFAAAGSGIQAAGTPARFDARRARKDHEEAQGADSARVRRACAMRATFHCFVRSNGRWRILARMTRMRPDAGCEAACQRARRERCRRTRG